MIARVLRTAVDAIRGSEKPSSMAGLLRPIDTAAIAREFNLEAVAAERGTANVPAATANALDAVEQQIIQKIEGEWAWQGGELVNNLRAYAQRLVGYSVASEYTRLEVQAKDTLTQLREVDHRAEAELGHLRERFIEARDELGRFRKRHRLERAARDNPRRWTTFGLLFVLIALESMANGLFFAKGSEFGIVGGVATAVVISFINVGFCFALGLWPIRWMNRRNIAIKVAAFLITLVALAGVVALHGFAAHYRDAMAAVGEERALGAAAASLMAAPWKLADLNSYYLFAMGALFSLTSIYKGATFDDPYPGYGPMTRRYDSARQAYSDRHFEVFEDLGSIKDETVRMLDEGIHQIPLYPQQAANIRAQRAAMVQAFRGYETAVETAANQLLSKYRDTNRRNRTAAVPAHFEATWRLAESYLASAEVRSLTADGDFERVDVQALLQELSRLLQQVFDEFEKLMTTYPHPTKMSKGNGAD
jgi:hypothetical protein